MVLNTTAAVATGTTRWNSTTPTSSVFSVGTDATVNASGGTYVAYLFASNAGGFGLTGTDNVITCGGFTCDGSGAASINLGYEPQWILVKRSNTTGDWAILDTMRGLYAPSTVSKELDANTSSAETNGFNWFINSTGFTIDSVGASNQFIYIAIRRGPMKTPTDATKVFIPIATTDSSSTKQVTNFVPDLQFVGIRGGSSTNFGALDRLRGISTNTSGSGQRLITSSTAAETSNNVSLGWDNTGFYPSAAYSGSSQIYWTFQRAPGFFDEVCYTGTGSAQNISHNLGVVPEMMILRLRNPFAGINWIIYNKTLGNAKALLFTTEAVISDPDSWNSTTPTSSVFSIGTGNSTSAGNYVVYLFATCAGVSKVGSYTGNGTTQTIDCGFGAGGVRFVLIKRTDSTGDWYVYDTARGMTVLTDPYLLLNSTAAQVATLGSVTTVSTGFALNSAILAAINVSGGSYIFLAIS